MKVKVFGRDSFESRWIPSPRGALNHRWLCNGHVLVHDHWYFTKGFQHAATYDSEKIQKVEILDWCQENAVNEYIIHPSGAVLFKELDKSVEFSMRWG